MDDKDFQDFLKEYNVTIVHFSHHAVMGHRVVFPDDLKHAIANFETETRSCCAIYPSHKMDLPGSVGVIFCPQHSNVLSVCASDSGSSDYGGVEGSLGSSPDREAILNSISSSTNTYNEWRIRGAKPIGIFVTDPNCIMVKQHKTFNSVGGSFQDIGVESVPLAMVKNQFPEMKIFKLGNDGLVEL